MGRNVKRLTDLEIDEISLVTRPANQHGLVAIAKSHQEDRMGVYDAAGDEVFEEELQIGDIVYAEDGTELKFVEEDDEDEGAEEGVMEMAKGSFSPGQVARNVKRFGVGDSAKAYGNRAAKDVKNTDAGKFVARNRGKVGLGTGALAGAGTGYAVGKSLGTQVLEELSKALTDDDRERVFAAAAEQFDEISKRNEQLEELVLGLYDDRDAQGYAELAKSYELPVDPDEIGAIMFRASQVLPDSDLEVLDRVFSSVGQISKAAFTEIGYGGGMESDVLAQIFAVAGEAVSKADSSLSQEQAVTALFSANPDAYDEYESEQRRF